MATTFMDIEKKKLIKKFHVLLGKAGIDQAGKEGILAGYGVESTKDLSAYELLEACNNLHKLSDPKAAEMDIWRKRVLASIFGYFGALGITSDMNRAKGTATRAAKAETFNEIPLEQLRALYSAFAKKAKTIRQTDVVTADIVKEISSLN